MPSRATGLGAPAAGHGRPGTRARWIGAALLFLVVALLAALRLSGALEMGRVETLLARHPLAAPALYVAVHALCAALFMPCSPLTLLAGFLWGPYAGLAWSIAGAASAVSLTFLLARTTLGGPLRGYLDYPVAKRLIGALDRHDWRVVAFAHLNPVLPASSLGYLFGLSRIPFGRFLGASLVFMLPLQVALVCFGVSMREALQGGGFSAFGAWLLLGSVVLALFLVFRPALGRAGKERDDAGD